MKIYMGKVLYIDESGNSGYKNTTFDNETDAFFIQGPDDEHSDIFRSKYYSKPRVAKNAMKPENKEYKLDYDNVDRHYTIDQILEKIHKGIGIIDEPTTKPIDVWNKSVDKYNRFKMPTLNDKLQHGFAHVFFVRPDCNVTTNNGRSLTSNLRNNQLFSYCMKQSPKLVRELVHDNGSNNDFMLSLSNHVSAFSGNDESLEVGSYGTTYTGYKIAYGKNNIESKTAGTISVSFFDDKQMHIYQLHKLWVEYISGCYRGEIIPKESSILEKIIDYAGAIYYIITAEDNETILYWTKYYGVFPTNIPVDQFSWATTNVIKNPEDLNINYQYTFKEDFNPLSLTEFNKNARIGDKNNLRYAPTYDKTLGHVGQTWVGCPYIEQVQSGEITSYKLRFLRE